MRRCQVVSSGSVKASAACCTASTAQLVEVEDLRERPRRLGARRRLERQQLEIVLARGVVQAQLEHPRDGFGAGVRGRLETRAAASVAWISRAASPRPR